MPFVSGIDTVAEHYLVDQQILKKFRRNAGEKKTSIIRKLLTNFNYVFKRFENYFSVRSLVNKKRKCN